MNRNNGNSILKPNDLRIKRSQKQFPLGNGIENTTLPFPERPRYCNTIFKLQLKRLVKCRNRRYCCSHCEQLHQCPPFTTLQRNNLYKVLVEDENDISQEKTCKQANAQRKALGEHYKKNNEKIAKLRNEIYDFKELIYTLANKIDGKYKCAC